MDEFDRLFEDYEAFVLNGLIQAYIEGKEICVFPPAMLIQGHIEGFRRFAYYRQCQTNTGSW